MLIRPAERRDLPELLAIYNDVVAHTTAIYEDLPSTLEERGRWFDDRLAAGFPVLVAVGDDGVWGFSSFGEWRSRWGYRYTVEHSVHVRVDRRGRGVGRKLMEALFPEASARGVRTLVAHIDADAQGSIRLHASLGFEHVGRFREVGFKFGRWLDLVCMQRLVTEADRGGP